jgi:hypothetical protein
LFSRVSDVRYYTKSVGTMLDDLALLVCGRIAIFSGSQDLSPQKLIIFGEISAMKLGSILH